MSDEKWSEWQAGRIRELETIVRNLRHKLLMQTNRAEHWKHRALAKQPVRKENR